MNIDTHDSPSGDAPDRGRGRLLRLPRAVPIEVAFGLIARTFEALRPQPDLSPDLGAVFAPLNHEEIGDAVPKHLPPQGLVDDLLPSDIADSDTDEAFGRAALWAAALQRLIESRPTGPEVVLTSYGFVRTEDGLRLAAIRYLTPASAFSHREPRAATIDGHRFPIVVRPWLFIPHSAGALAAGCWARFTDDGGERKTGLLTCLHAIQPENAALGERVAIDASRGEPGGILVRREPMLDAALVCPEDPPAVPMQAVEPSTTAGYKDLLLRTGRRDVSACIAELPPRRNARTLPDSPIGTSDFCTLTIGLRKGDSGCIGLDMELGRFVDPPPPYVMYRGASVVGPGQTQGFALMLRQPSEYWNLELLMPQEEEGTIV